MANIDVKLTQAAFDGAQSIYGSNKGNLLGNLSSMAPNALAAIQGDAASVSGYTFEGGQLRINFADGSYDQLNNLVLSNANAPTGTGTATGATLYVPNTGTADVAGHYSFSYDLGSAVPSVQLISATTNSLTLKSQLPTSSPDYDKVLGNGSLQVKGAITIDAAGHLSGSLSSVTLTADKLLSSATVTGSFDLSSSTGSLIDGTDSLDMHGKLDNANLQFTDGSYVKASGIGLQVDSVSLLGALSPSNGALPGNDTIHVELADTLSQVYSFDAGAGDDQITLTAGGSSLNALAGSGNDTITLVSGHHQVDGGAGSDTVVYGGARSAYTITKTAAGIDVASAGGIDHLSNVERLQFGTDSVAFDVGGSAGQAYRLYQAAFNRAADSTGLGYYIGVLDKGASLRDIATGFIASKEFATLYGTNPSNEAFVAHLYDNVLHRQYEQSGFDYWVDVLNHGEARAQVLANFGESAENQAQVIGTIQNGISFTPYHA